MNLPESIYQRVLITVSGGEEFTYNRQVDVNVTRERTPLPPSGQEALALLESHLDSTAASDEIGDGIARANAQTLLVADGYTEAGAENLLTSLENRGYIYTVNGQIYVTE